ncbi:MAG: ABC transporter permease [Bacteroidetes bacterium]|nr:MAG: ABC transporter permease [Bacteroidota bacterium]
MFDIEKWQEIFSSIRSNKLRTFLTGFSVAWGIFMLMILLGSGKGLENGFRKEFEEEATNGIWIRPGQTSIAYKGIQPGRHLEFTLEDYELLKRELEHYIDVISAEYYIFGWGGSAVNYKNLQGQYSLRGIFPEHRLIEFTEATEGRFLNRLDIENREKVCIIGSSVKEEMFKDENPVGKYVKIAGVPFKIVGVFKEELGQNERGKVYVPLTTAQRVYSGHNKIDEIALVTKSFSVEESQKIVNKIKELLAKKHQFALEDPRAVHIYNNLEQYETFTTIFGGINAFIWLIGIGTLIAGVIGVGNIMMVIVKERTKEIGIRKAIGATPASIVALIIQEAIVITTFFGYVGLVLGINLMELVSKTVPPNQIFTNPDLDFNTALTATIILIVAGTLAGISPAYQAAKLKPIEALRDE